MKVSIVGGSLGGLTAACLLRDLGYDVSVYERSAVRLEQRGAGIGFLPATYRYLQSRAGVDLTKISVATSKIVYLDADSTVTYEAAHNYLFSSWNTVYASTLDHFGMQEYHLSSEMTDFSQTPESVTVNFKDGRSVTSDLLVAADGIGSSARSKLIPSCKSEYSGYVAWRGMVPESLLSSEMVERLGSAITYFVYPHSHILVYPIPDHDGRVTPGNRLINFVWYCNYAAGEEFNSLMTDKNRTLRDVSIPAGTAKAAADGWALAEALEKFDSVPEALEVFQRSQLALAKNLLDRTRRVGAKSQFLNTWDPRDPEVIFGLHKPGE